MNITAKIAFKLIPNLLRTLRLFLFVDDIMEYKSDMKFENVLKMFNNVKNNGYCMWQKNNLS